MPLWNPYAGLGMPLVANAQSAVGSPLTSPALAVPEQRMWNAVILFRLLVGALGCLVLLLLLGAAADRGDGRGAAVRPGADVHALGAAGVDVGRGRSRRGCWRRSWRWCGGRARCGSRRSRG